MKLIIEVDLDHMPMLPDVMSNLNQGLIQAVEKVAVPLDLSEIVRERLRWVEDKNVGLIMELATADGMQIFGRVGVTEGEFDTTSWAEALAASNPKRYAVHTSQ